MEFKPHRGYMLVKLLDQNETTESGLVLAKMKSDRRQVRRGEVMAVGEGNIAEDTGNVIEMPFKIGDVVAMDAFTDQFMTIDGEDFVIVNERQIVGTYI